MNITTLPIQPTDRILLLDCIRGIALCGILIINIFFFANPIIADLNFTVLDEPGWGNTVTWYFAHFIIKGSYRALFSMLFGAGFLLLISRLEKNNSGLMPADIFYRRLIWLLVFGLIDAYILQWVGDILYAYALCGLFIFPFRNSSVKLLIGLAIFFIAITMYKDWSTVHERTEIKEKGVAAAILEAEKKTLTEAQNNDLQAWKHFQDERTPEHLKKEVEKQVTTMHGSYTQIWSHQRAFIERMESTSIYNSLFFDVLIFIFLGMALYKLGVLTGERSTSLYVIFVVIGYGSGITYGIVEGSIWRQSNMEFFDYLKLTPFPIKMNQIHRVCVSFGHLGLIVLLWKSGFFMWFLKPFIAVGQMAFTNYLGQSIICTLIFNGYGLGLYGKFQRFELWYFVISIWIFQIFFSVVWLRYFRMGPLEWVWRGLSYWKIQALKRSRKSEQVLTT